jgi:hypothetical protein
VALYWRNATATTPPAFTNMAMFDDGAHNDGITGDQVYGASIPAQPHQAIVEFYIEAMDEQGLRRTWPGPAYDGTTLLGQVANALYQVDNSTATFPQPIYRLIMTGAERQELSAIWSVDNSGVRIDAAMNGTFVTSDGTGTEARYRCGFRNRGNGTRGAVPHNFRVSIPNEQRWHGVRELNLNTMYTHSQVLGSAPGGPGFRSHHLRARADQRDRPGQRRLAAVWLLRP